MRTGHAAPIAALLAIAPISAAEAPPSRGELSAASARAAAEAPDSKRRRTRDERRVYGRAQQVFVWSAPSIRSRRLGSFRAGSSVSVPRDVEPVRGSGCSAGFLPVLPRGFVCADDRVTFDANDRTVRAMAFVQPAPAALPFRYAISNGAPLYRRLPTPAEWARAERDLGKAGSYKKYPWNERHERLAEERRVTADAPVPFFLADGGSARAESEAELVKVIAPLGSMIAYTRAFEHAGRTWLLSSDGTIVPADRVRPYRTSSFRGVALGGEARLPLAWVREQPRTKFRRAADGSFVDAGSTWPPRSWVALEAAGEPEGPFAKTRERDARGQPLWIRNVDATIVHREDPPSRVAEGEKWIVVHVRAGTLVAYEGARPVFTTLISPGAGGISRAGVDPVEASTTPRGSYRIQYKYRSQTMSPEKDKPERERTFWISEVPYAQYFQIPFALHTAYWHESFGDWMSGGCVNLSPLDGQWLFNWSGPGLPDGWDTVWAGGENGRGTVIVIGR